MMTGLPAETSIRILPDRSDLVQTEAAYFGRYWGRTVLSGHAGDGFDTVYKLA